MYIYISNSPLRIPAAIQPKIPFNLLSDYHKTRNKLSIVPNTDRAPILLDAI